MLPQVAKQSPNNEIYPKYSIDLPDRKASIAIVLRIEQTKWVLSHLATAGLLALWANPLIVEHHLIRPTSLFGSVSYQVASQAHLPAKQHRVSEIASISWQNQSKELPENPQPKGGRTINPL